MFFIDSNILCYAIDDSESEKQAASSKLLEQISESDDGMISTQSLQEFANTAIRKFKYPKLAVANMVENLSKQFSVHQNTLTTVMLAIDICDKNQLSFWDSLILAAAVETGCDILYSEDLNAGQVVSGVKIVNPFEE